MAANAVLELFMSDVGSLFIVATPIGNLGDITVRAIATLKNVDLIAAEDTRHSKKLLMHLGIQKPLVALHDFNEREKSKALLKHLEQGQSIALISDAGTPLISDPGYHLVALVRAAGVAVVPIPGPCALIAALSVSGLPTDKFIFEGFLAAKKTARQKRLAELQDETRTLIFYESTHRLMSTLKDMEQIFGSEREIVLAKELTKSYETVLQATIASLLEWLSADTKRQQGEFVLLVRGAVAAKNVIDADVIRVLNLLVSELTQKQAVTLAAKITGVSKNVLYEYALGHLCKSII